MFVIFTLKSIPMNFNLLNTSILLTLLSCFIMSCGNETKTTETETEPKTEEITKVVPPTDSYCFRVGSKDDIEADMEELLVNVSEGKISGVYNIVPAGKDSRLGTLHGTIQDKTITATYRFEQEGEKDETEVTITLGDKDVKIVGSNPEYGIDGTMPKVDCE